MTVQELQAKGAIYFENIQTGFENQDSQTIILSEEEARKMFCEMWIASGKLDGFVDFYYYRLKPEEKSKVESILSTSEIEFLHEQNPDPEELVFPINETLLDIVVKLNASEMLFSTLYFTKEKSTWWGNYKQEYIVFRPKSIK